jgi:Ca2+-binding RTX toxin-like protein
MISSLPIGFCPDIDYVSSVGGIEVVQYDGELTAAGLVADTLTINGTSIEDTTVIHAAQIGSGTFRSGRSPLFDFRSFTTVTVNGGTGGFDQVIINGTEGPDAFTSPAADAVALTGGVRVNMTAGGLERVDVNSFGGNDSIVLGLTDATLTKFIFAGDGNDTVNVSTSVDATIFGGDGDDLLVGSPAADTIFGGAGNDNISGLALIDTIYGDEGNDIIIGGTGNDNLFGGDGSDRFIWNNGDNSDIVEGDEGVDVQIVNGAAAGDVFLLRTATGNQARAFFERTNLVPFSIDMGKVEQVDMNTLAGADQITIRDLSTTDVRQVIADVGAQADLDTVSIDGRTVSDVLALTSLANGIVNLAGLPYDVNVANLNSAIDADTLTLNTLEGNDRVTSSDGLNAIFGTTLVAANRLTINGGEGDDQLSGFGQLNGDAGRDVLIGGAFSQTLNGGDDADLIEGGGGDDSLVGGAGEDTFVGGAGNDTVDGGGAFDTILIRGTSGNDTINVFQSSSTTLIHTVNGDTQTDTLAAGTVERTIVDAGDGADLIRARLADALFNQPGQSVQIVVHGGSHEAAGDRLVIVDDGADDLTIYRKSQLNTDGTVTIGPGNTETFEHVFTGIERVDFVDENGNAVNNAANGPQLAVFKHDPFESNDDRFNATHVGANETVNIDPTIDPGPVANPFGDNQNLPGDQDFYRVVADVNGILDFQVYFRQVPTLASGRPGLPNNGNLDIEVLDVGGNVITGFGNNDATSDERVRIPAVAGQTYFLRVFGNGVAINNYNITITNHPPTVPYDLELNDILQVGTVTVGTSVTQFTATIAPINRVQNPANFDLVGKTVEFTSGPNIGRQAVISAFNNITGIFSVTNSGSGLIQAPNVNDNFIIETTDTGRSQFDNTLRDNTPVITFRLDDGIFLHDLPGNALDDNPPDEIIVIPFNTGNLAAPATAGGYRIAIFVEGEPQQQPNTAPQIPIGYARRVRNAADTAFVEGVYTFDFGIDAIGAPLALTNGSHFISAKVEITDPAVQRRFGYGDRSVSLEVVVDTLTPPVSFGDPAISDDGLHANSDSGDPFDPVTLSDNATNDTTPTFFGRAEANSIVRAYLDRTNNGLSADDFLLGQTVASPLDGTNQHPFGEWEITSTLNMNDPTVIATLGVDGIRNIFVTAEDQAGNISPVGALNTLQIFVDTRGPQVTDVFITNVPAFNLFTLKPNNAPQGPTPAVNSLTIRVQDFPARALGFLYEALSNVPPLPPIVLVGDHSGPIAAQVQFVSDPVNPGAIARGSVILTFNSPLPDDRYTLTIGDSVIDPVGNRLDGENRTAEPLGAKDFPTGDGIPGGDFLARFTVDSRPEVATWSQGLVYADINGNLVWDYEGQDNDFTNRDFIYNFGNVTDAYFTGNFAKPAGSGTAPATKGGAVASGYDKVGAYGAFNGTLVYQFALDTNDDGVVDLVSNMPAAYQVNAIPVSGNFDGSAANGEEIGAFDGTFWYLDVNGNNAIDLGERFATDLRGIPVTGDFNGDGATDLATFNNDTNTFFFDLDRSGSVDNTVVFGFTGFTDKPISGDVNLDGVDDIVVWVAGRQGQLPREIGEFHFLVSDNVPAVRGVGTLPSAIFNPFSHAPLGNDFISQFGDEFALPLLANFDPPLDSEAVTDTESPTLTNEVNPLDTNVDGRVTPLDALLVINTLNKGTFLDLDPMIRAVAAFGTQKPDTNADRKITPLDALKVINGLNRQSQGEASNQAFAALAATTDAIFGVDQDDEEEDPLLDLLATDQHGHAASGANRVG